MKIKCLGYITIVFLFLITPTTIKAGYDFSRITTNASQNVQGQLSVEITDLGLSGSDQIVGFTFYNSGPIASSITNIYIDDGPLAELLSITGFGEKVNFEAGSLSPGELPGGGTFTTSVEFSAGVNPSPPINGINPGESLEIVYSLIEGQTYDDLINAINREDVSIGLHVQAIGVDGQSDSFIMVVPLPATILLGLIGLGAGSWKLRKTI